ncbi:MAG: hypothetical protein KIT73_17550 [Burkholderiales bacterium]|nr:hypothetical protein [Burkholderiales bacterium]
MRPVLSFAAALIAAFSVPSVAVAHHGWSQYEGDQPVTLTGTIESASYENPHGTLRLKTDDRTWTVVLAPPYRMESRGLARAALIPGAATSVTGYVHRSGSNELRAERITVDGKTTELR